MSLEAGTKKSDSSFITYYSLNIILKCKENVVLANIFIVCC